jgi:hypothetical protein
VDILHCCVDSVHFLLEGVRLFVKVLDEHGHVSKDVGVDDGAQGVGKQHEEDLDVAHRQDVVARQQQHRVIQADKVLPDNGLLVNVVIAA